MADWQSFLGEVAVQSGVEDTVRDAGIAACLTLKFPNPPLLDGYVESDIDFTVISEVPVRAFVRKCFRMALAKFGTVHTALPSQNSLSQPLSQASSSQLALMAPTQSVLSPNMLEVLGMDANAASVADAITHGGEGGRCE